MAALTGVSPATLRAWERRYTVVEPERTESQYRLYDDADVTQTMQQVRGVDYGDEVRVTDGMTAVFHDAGHILGSAII